MPPPLPVSEERPSAADRVPVLTEVVELRPGAPAVDPASADLAPDAALAADAAVPDDATPDDAAPGSPVGPAAPLAPPPPGPPDASALVDEVLAALAPRLDALFEDRVRAALAPAIARAAEGLIRDARQELAATLCDVVEEAVRRTLRHHEQLAPPDVDAPAQGG